MSALQDHYPDIALRVDDELVPAKELQWEMTAPCGCACGWHVVTNETITLEQTWLEFCTNATKVSREKALGFTIALTRRPGRIKEGDCTHSPKWGVEPRPDLEGFTWAATGKRAKSVHLVEIAIEKDSYGPYEAKAVESLCKRSRAVRWSTQWYHIEDLVDCVHCVAAARALGGAA